MLAYPQWLGSPTRTALTVLLLTLVLCFKIPFLSVPLLLSISLVLPLNPLTCSVDSLLSQ